MRVDQLDPPAVGAQTVDQRTGVVLVAVGDRQDRRLHRRQPRGERAGVVLGEDGEEALDGPEQRAVDHDRPVALVVGADVLQLEALRELEVELDRRHLPGAADGVARLHRDLGAVERTAALVHHQVELRVDRDGAERLDRLVPLVVGADRLALRLGRQLEVEVVEAVVAQDAEHELERAGQLGDDLLARAEDVRVVLGHAPHAREPVHHPRLLVAVHGAELEQAQRQLAVRAHPAAVDQDVERAVHRLEVVLGAAVELHRRVHAVGEPVEVAGDLEQVRLRDVRRVDELVARLLVALARVVLHHPPDRAALRVEHREARADLVGEREQVELGAELAVVALLGLLEAVQVLLERGLRFPRGAVDALEHRALLVAPPVRAGDLGELERAEPLRRRHVRTTAQVDELGRHSAWRPAGCGTPR